MFISAAMEIMQAVGHSPRKPSQVQIHAPPMNTPSCCRNADREMKSRKPFYVEPISVWQKESKKERRSAHVGPFPNWMQQTCSAFQTSSPAREHRLCRKPALTSMEQYRNTSRTWKAKIPKNGSKTASSKTAVS